jgi:Tfp pilus assembly protein PilF
MFQKAAEGKLKAAGHYNLGLLALRQRKHREALTQFEVAITADPQLANAHAMVGLMRERLGIEGAESGYQNALSIEKFNSIANTIEAVRHMKASDWTQSFARSRMALIGYAESPNAYLTLARVYYEQRQFDLARLVCEQALEIDPLNAPIQNLLGLTFLRLDDVRAALVWFEKATNSNPNLPEAHMNLASTVLNYGDFERAEKHFSLGLKLSPGSLDAKMGRAVALRGLKRFEESLADYDAVLAAEPSNVDVRYNKCLLLAVYAEKYEDGLKVCEEFVSMAPPKHPKRSEIKKRLPGIRDTIKFMKEDAEAEKDAQVESEDSGQETESNDDKATTIESEPKPDTETNTPSAKPVESEESD